MAVFKAIDRLNMSCMELTQHAWHSDRIILEYDEVASFVMVKL